MLPTELSKTNFTGIFNTPKQGQNLLFRNGFGYAWIHQEVGNKVEFLKSFVQRISDIYRVSQKKVSIKNFYSELLKASVHSFFNLFGFSISVSFVWCII